MPTDSPGQEHNAAAADDSCHSDSVHPAEGHVGCIVPGSREPGTLAQVGCACTSKHIRALITSMALQIIDADTTMCRFTALPNVIVD